jgi:molybdopterin synthase catalytic subunit
LPAETTPVNANVGRADLTEQRIDCIEHEVLVARRAAGAVVGFVGAGRDRDGS